MDIVRLFKNPTKSLCGPSLFYLVVSAIVLLSVFVQNVGNNSHQHIVLVNSAIRTPSKLLMFIVNIIGIMLWCWILNLMCKANHPEIAWLVVLFPYIIIVSSLDIILHVCNSDNNELKEGLL